MEATRLYTTPMMVPDRLLPYWDAISNLCQEDKIKLITLISSSLESNNVMVTDDKTEELASCCEGKWVGNETADDIIRLINERKSNPGPVLL